MFHLKDARLINTIRVASTHKGLWCHMRRLTFGTSSGNHSNSPDTAVETTTIDMQTDVETKPGDEGNLLMKNHIYEVLDPNLCQHVAKQNQVENQEEYEGTELEGPQPDPQQTQSLGSVFTRLEDTTHVLNEQGVWCSSGTRTSTVRNIAEKVPEKAATAAGEQQAALWSNANYACFSQLNKSLAKWLDDTKQQDVLQHNREARQPQAEEPLATREEREIGEPQAEAEKPREQVEPKVGDLGAEKEEPEAGEPRAEVEEANLLINDSLDPNMIVQALSRLNAEVNHGNQEVAAGDAPEQDHTEAMEEEVTGEQEAAGDASAKATAELNVPAGGAVERQYTATAVGRVILTARVAVTEKTSPTEGVTEQQDEDSDAELLSEPEQIGSTPPPPLEEEEGVPQWPEGDEWDAVELEGNRPEGAGPQEDALTVTVTISGLRSAIKIYISPVEPHRSRPKQRRR